MKENPYELIYMSRGGDEWSLQALFRYFEPSQRACVNSLILRYRALEIYRDDLIQEACIMIPKAIDTYRDDMACSFKTFLNIVTERRVYSLLRHYSADRVVQMHQVVYFEDHVSESGIIYDAIPLGDRMSDPQYRQRYNEALDRVRDVYHHMKVSEKEVMHTYMSGYSYQESCEKLALSYKTYDGRLQRVKKKIRDAVEQ